MIVDISGYDGSLLHQRFAYRFFRDNVNPLGDIIAFRGWMRVEAEYMIDQEDVLNKAFIYADDAINFLWEVPGLQAFGAVAYQRLLNTRIADILSGYLGKPVNMNGDDLMVDAVGKCSVSITHVNQGVALGHTGINIVAGEKAPDIAYSTRLTQQQANDFIQAVIDLFYRLNQSLFTATTKLLT